MKKLLILLLFVCAIGWSQDRPIRADVVFLDTLTTTERDALTMRPSQFALIGNSTVDSVQAWNGTKWSSLGSGGSTLTDAEISTAFLNENPNTDLDGSGTSVTAGTNVTVTGSGTSGSPYVINSTASGTGDVTGPASSTDNAIVRFDATTGKIIQNSVVTIGDTGNADFGGGSLTDIGQIDVNTEISAWNIQLQRPDGLAGDAPIELNDNDGNANVLFNDESNSNKLTYINAETAQTIVIDDLSATDDQTLAEVLTEGNTAGSNIDMQSNDIVDIGTINADDAYHLRSNPDALYIGATQNENTKRWYFSKTTGPLRIGYQNSDNTDYTGSYTQHYTFNETGVPSNGSDVIDVDYFNSNQDGTGTDDQTASEVDITDAGDYYTATEVEAALQEVASGSVIEHVGGDVEGFTVLNLVNDAVISENILDGEVQTSDIADNNVTEPKLAAFNSPTDGNSLTWDSTNGLVWASGAHGILLHPDSPVTIDSIYVGTTAQIEAQNLGSNVLSFSTDGKTVYTEIIPLTANGDDLIVGDDVNTWVHPVDITILSVQAFTDVAPTGSTATFDIEIDDGTPASMLSTLITIDAGERNSLTAATPPVISTASLTAGDYLTFNVDQVGSTVAGRNGTITIRYTED